MEVAAISSADAHDIGHGGKFIGTEVAATVSFHYYSLVSVVLLYQACCVSFLRLLAG